MPLLAPLPNWTDVPNSRVPSVYSQVREDARQIRPTLATLPSGTATGLAPESRTANPPRFSRSLEFTAPTRFGLIVVVPPTLDSWAPTLGQPKVLLRYALPEYVNQVRPTLATLPTILNTAEVSRPANPPTFSRVFEFVSPTLFGLSLVAQVGFQSNAFQNSSTGLLKGFQVLVISDPEAWLPFVPPKAIAPRFAQGPEFISPPKFGLSSAALATPASWLPTEGQKAVPVWWYPDGLESAAPTNVSTVLPTVSWLPAVAQNAVLLTFTRAAQFNAPDKFSFAVLIPGFQANAFQNNVTGSIAAFQVSSTVTLTVSPVRWTANLPPRRYEPTYARALEFIAPEKVLPTVPTVSWVAAWRQDFFNPTALWLNYARIEDSQLKGAATPQLFPVTITSWLGNVAQNKIPAPFAKAPEFAGPDKFGVVVVAVPTPVSWKTTEGEKAVVLRYAPSDSVNQIRPTLATLPVLLSGLNDIAPKAQPAKFAVTDWSAPSKFGLTIAAPLTVAGWVATEGAKQVQLTYAPPDIARQVQPTLSTLPTLLYGLAEQPWTVTSKFARAEEFAAPAKFGVTQAAAVTLASWALEIGVRVVKLGYWNPDALLQVLGPGAVGVFRRLGTPYEGSGSVTGSKITNYEILAKILAALGVPSERLVSGAATKGTAEEALATRQSTKATAYEAKGTVLRVGGLNQEAKGRVAPTKQAAYEIVSTVAPKQVQVVYEVLRGATQLVRPLHEAAGKVTGIGAGPSEFISAIFNPVALFAGKVTPLIKVVTGRILQAVGISKGKVLN